jgi:hypothetical protein
LTEGTAPRTEWLRWTFTKGEAVLSIRATRGTPMVMEQAGWDVKHEPTVEREATPSPAASKFRTAPMKDGIRYNSKGEPITPSPAATPDLRAALLAATAGLPERLAQALADQLTDAAPPKIEGGSPARRQWIADVLAVQIATHTDDRFASLFKEAMDGAPGVGERSGEGEG